MGLMNATGLESNARLRWRRAGRDENPRCVAIAASSKPIADQAYAILRRLSVGHLGAEHHRRNPLLTSTLRLPMDLNGPLANTYYKLPAAAQNAVCTAYGWREGRTRFGTPFDERLAWLTETESWTREQIRRYQDEQVARVVEHAYVHVDYYRELMKARRLVPSDVTSVADLPKLPILTKDDVRENRLRLVAVSTKPHRLISRRTSGSTGSSITTLATRDAVAFQWAVWWRHRTRFGVHPGALHANFTGKPVVPIAQASPPFWRWNRVARQAIIPMQQVVPSKAPAIHRFLQSRAFDYLAGYPSILHSYADMAIEAGLRLVNPPQAVFTGAENLYSFQREAISSYTGAVVSEQYGMTEGAANASECEHLVLHEDFEFGVMEAANPTPDPKTGGTSGRIIATGFSNHAFPLIRYDTGDVATWLPGDHECACGRHSQAFASIDGRVEEYVTTPEGHKVMRFDYVFKESVNVRKAQIVQNSTDSIIVRLVPTEAFSTADEEDLRVSIATWISPELRVSFDVVGAIPSESNGKFRAVIRDPDASV